MMPSKRICLIILMIPGITMLTNSVWGHSAERGLIMLLPTGYYILGGVIAVVMSFLVLATMSAERIERISCFHKELFCIPRIPVVLTSTASFLSLCILIFIGLKGSRDPLENLLPLTIWTVWWIGFTLLQFIVGDLWKFINPWTGPLHWFRKISIFNHYSFGFPEKIGFSPAILQFFGFAWFELVDLAPEDPGRLAWVIIIYWLFNFIALMLFGKAWLERGEPFTLFFRLVGLCSPFQRQQVVQRGVEKTKISITWPGQGLIRHPLLPFSGVLFVLLTLSTVSFDGFSKTFVWLKAMEINPLAFPGRSAVQWQNSVGLLVAFLVLFVAFYLSVLCGHCLTKDRLSRFSFAETGKLAGRLVYSIIPISLVFHFAHYLTVLLVNGQYFLHGINDPFNSDWTVFDTLEPVSASFLSNYHSVSVIWSLQTLFIVLGHVIGILVAHMLAYKIYGFERGGTRTVTMSQLGLATLMVSYTWFGLWLLSTASIG